MKHLYRTSEAKAALGVGTTKLYELINNGMLDARRFGRRTYITGASIEALVGALKPVITPTMAAELARAERGNPEHVAADAT
jgi:excisionase family DNA binding protein